MSHRVAGIFLIVRRSLRQHALSTLITVMSVALASGLVMAVFSVKQQTHEAFTGTSMGFDAVLGARGSQLQLVLNTVFHLETSPGNIPWAMYQAMQKDSRVELAIPYAVGDNYRGFRIVGTTEELFSKFEYQAGKKFKTREGKFFDSQRQEAVLGSFVAQRTGLQVGDTFNPYHGVNFDEKMAHPVNYVVTGILESTNSPSDRVVWIPIEGIFRMPGHVLKGGGKEFEAQAGEEIPDSEKEVSAVMLKFKNAQLGGMAFHQMINLQGNKATLAWPIERVMLDLFDKIGWLDKVLALVAYLVVVVAAGSILASIYNTMNERRREFAILRALGARRATVFSAIVLESGSIAALGSLMGFVVYAAILAGAAVVVRAQTGVVLDVFHSANVDLTDKFSVSILILTPLCMIAVGALAGIVPAMKAYGTDVATNLAPTS